MRREGYFDKPGKKKPKYTAKPYEQMKVPGERVQIDVKYVPEKCTKAMGKGTKLYQFTAIDECTRKRYLEGFTDNSSYSAAVFVQNAVKYFKFPTKTFSGNAGRKETFQPTLFQKVLMTMGIRHKQIWPYTPRHNGKVERSHRKDNERFYSKRSFYSLADLHDQLKRYNREYNQTPMRHSAGSPPMSSSLLFFSNV